MMNENIVLQTIQNKLHFAATGKTAAELIAERVDAAKPNMGLTSWKSDVVRKWDVTIAKNYLKQDEIEELNRLVVMFLDYAEDQARRRKQVFLNDWTTKLDDFLKFNERRILPGVQQLEDIAKKLPKPKKSRKPRGGFDACSSMSKNKLS